jgi:hypothetical protein
VVQKLQRRTARSLARKLNAAMRFTGMAVDPTLFLASASDHLYDLPEFVEPAV